MIEKMDTPIAGCFLLRPRKLADERGHFVKFYQQAIFDSMQLDLTAMESYFSVSHQGVLRGMHFQAPPFDHHKLVTCIQGQVLDVVCDLRVNSVTYGQCTGFELSDEHHDSLYIPNGLAHGFYVRSTQATLLYNVTSAYNPQADAGIAWDSLPFAWPNAQPIISARDRQFPTLLGFTSPFK